MPQDTQGAVPLAVALAPVPDGHEVHHLGVGVAPPVGRPADAGVMPHGQIGRQFATMVQYGMTPLQAIQAATRNAAQALGRERDIGTIAVGRYGDLTAVSGDPLSNIRLLEKPDAVVKGGALIPPAR